MEELKQRRDDWDMFLSQNGFVAGVGPHGKIPQAPVTIPDVNKKNNSEGLNSHGAEDFTIHEKTPKKTCPKRKCQPGILVASTVPSLVIPPNPTPVTPVPTIPVVPVTPVRGTRRITRSMSKQRPRVKISKPNAPCSMKNPIHLDPEPMPTEQSHIQQHESPIPVFKKSQKTPSKHEIPECLSSPPFVPHDVNNTTDYYEPPQFPDDRSISSRLERKDRRIVQAS